MREGACSAGCDLSSVGLLTILSSIYWCVGFGHTVFGFLVFGGSLFGNIMVS